MDQKLNFFISYAHEDESIKNDLLKFLSPLQKVEIWQDRMIKAGELWDDVITKELATADVILLIISIDFINSGYISRTELKMAMEKHDRGEARVIPIIARKCPWEDLPFRKLQALPISGTLDQALNKDETYTSVYKAIKSVIDEMIELKTLKTSAFANISYDKNLPNIFFSVGSPMNELQKQYIQDLKLLFQQNHVNLVTLEEWDDDEPMKPILKLMKTCKGCIVLLTERYYVEKGYYKRGGKNESSFDNRSLTTPWCQIEATLAYGLGLPLLILKQNTVHPDGIFIESIKTFEQVEVDIENIAEWSGKDKKFILHRFLKDIKKHGQKI